MSTLQEWMDIYEEKTKMKVELGDGFHLFFIPEKGFIRIKVDMNTKTIIVKELCGDGRYWYQLTMDLAKIYNLDKAATFLCREPRCYIKLFGGKVLVNTKDYVKGTDGKNGIVEMNRYKDNIYFAVLYINGKNEDNEC